MSLPDDYVRAIGTNRPIWLVIMGKDQYENDPEDIAFLRNDWVALRNTTCSGGHVLRSLGFRIDEGTVEDLEGRYGTPRELFLNLARSGIVFMNFVYSFLGKGTDVNLGNADHVRLVEEADFINREICNRAWYVILSGQASARHHLPSHALAQSIEAVHPASGCRNHRDPKIRNRWRAWWSQDAIYNWVKPITELHQALSALREGQ